MRDCLFDAGRQFLFALPPEAAHKMAIRALAMELGPRPERHVDERLSLEIAGLRFANPLGMAAGFDKNAEAVSGIFNLGFGSLEIGSVTPRAQPGNPSPRLFRLERHAAIINRMGFNNDGHKAVLARLEGRVHQGILGVNIGANKDSEDRIGDYVAGISAFSGVADYFTANISSPNTPGLRNLQSREALAELFERVLEERDRQPVRRPVLLKIAPDLFDEDLDAISAECLEKKIDGLVISNTTLSRVEVTGARHAAEAGGLSGRPVFERSTIVLAKMRKRLGPDMPIIGVGGIESAATAVEKIRAGADLVQVYTGFIYGGPVLAGKILKGLSEVCEREKLPNIRSLRDSRLDDYAERAIPASV